MKNVQNFVCQCQVFINKELVVSKKAAAKLISITLRNNIQYIYNRIKASIRPG